MLRRRRCLNDVAFIRLVSVRAVLVLLMLVMMLMVMLVLMLALQRLLTAATAVFLRRRLLASAADVAA